MQLRSRSTGGTTTLSPPIPTGVLEEEEEEIIVEHHNHMNGTANGIANGKATELKSELDEEHPMVFVWPNITLLAVLHIGALYGLYLGFVSSPWQSNAFSIFLAVLVTVMLGLAGPHRLWTHKSYKATLPLRIFLMLNNCAAGQTTTYNWVRYHRVHHKFSETNADPHNAKRGVFFSHVGWLMVKPHPACVKQLRLMDMSDCMADPVIRFQRKYFYQLMAVFAVIIPTAIPVLCWGDSIWNALFVCVIFRGVYAVNMGWLVNSIAHIWGNRPYDSNIGPTEHTAVSLATVGEGWHNYHHTFPWDYKAAEIPVYKYNVTAGFIELMGKMGLAYDLRSVDPETIKKRQGRTGDGSHSHQTDTYPWVTTGFCQLFGPQMWAALVLTPILRDAYYSLVY